MRSASLPTPSARKRVLVVSCGMLEVVAGAALGDEVPAGAVEAGTLMMAGPDLGAASESVAAAGARLDASASVAAEADSALINNVRIDVRLPLLAIFLVLLVMGALRVTSPSRRLDW